MKKSIITLLLILLTLLCLSSCNNTKHKHTEEPFSAVDATCTQTGMTEGKKCSICGEVLEGGVEISPLNHRWGNDEKCTICGIRKFTNGIQFALNEEGTGYYVTGIGETVTEYDITIPNTYMQLPVIGIRESFFNDFENILRLVIPESVIDIQVSQYQSCGSLVEICNLSNVDLKKEMFSSANILHICNSENCDLCSKRYIDGEFVFCYYDGEYCLVSYSGDEKVIKFPENCNGMPYNIRNYLFSGTKCEEIKFSSGIRKIGEEAFSYCDNIKSIELPYGVEEIGARAFLYCSSLEEITIPKTLKSSATEAFACCYKLEDVYISDMTAWCAVDFGWRGNPLYKASNLYLNDVLVTDLVIPDGVTKISAGAFYPYDKLQSVYIPSSVVEIGNIYESTFALHGAFSGCENLQTVTFAQNSQLQILGNDTFYGCTKLSTISIPNSLKQLGADVFYGTESLSTYEDDSGVYIGNSYNPHLILLSAKSVDINHNTRFISSGSFTEKYFSVSDITIPSSVEFICESAFFKCCFKNVVIGAGVKFIGRTAFYQSTLLTDVNIPSSVQFIGNSAFEECPNLVFNEFGGGLYLGNTYNPYSALIKVIYTDELKTIDVHDSTRIIAQCAFEYKLVNKVNLPDNLLYISAQAFINTEITMIEIPQSVIKIGESAFEWYNEKIIIYGGTIKEFVSITDDSWWSHVTGNYKILCSDGEILIP